MSIAISGRSSGVKAPEHSVETLQNDMAEIGSDLIAMFDETRRLDRFPMQDECTPDRCCFVSSYGKHLPHCGPCVVTMHHDIEMLMRLRNEEVVNEKARGHWKELVIKMMLQVARKRCSVYLIERERCVKKIIHLGRTECNGMATPYVSCPLCVLKIAHDMPGRTSTVYQRTLKPYAVQLGYSHAFEKHLQQYHWRVGYTCAGCQRTFLSAASGRLHVNTAKLTRCRGAAILSLNGSWLCMRRQVMRRYSVTTELTFPWLRAQEG